jgi:hypothetical protein
MVDANGRGRQKCGSFRIELSSPATADDSIVSRTGSSNCTRSGETHRVVQPQSDPAHIPRQVRHDRDDADRASLTGDVTVSVNSEIPSGMHQLFDAIVNFLLEDFRGSVLDRDVQRHGPAQRERESFFFASHLPLDVFRER